MTPGDPVAPPQPAQDAPGATTRPCEACGATILPEAGYRGPDRKLCRGCATSATYQRRWLAGRPDYREGYNAARRVTHEPRACVACNLVFTPRRRDARYCCGTCADRTRRYGYATDESRAAHRSTHNRKDAPR